MTDNTGLNDAAVSWLRGLAARGVTVSLRNNRLAMSPSRAYKELTDSELLTLRHHRASIKDCVRAGFRVQTSADPTGDALVSTVTPAPEPPPPTPCAFCYQAPCIGAAHPAFRALHESDPAEIAKRTKAATTEMWHQLGVFTDFSWPSDPPDTPDEARSRALRRKLGWEATGHTVNEKGYLK